MTPKLTRLITKHLIDYYPARLGYEMNDDTTFRDLGMDSFDTAMLAMEIERIYDVEITDEWLQYEWDGTLGMLNDKITNK